MDRPQTTQIAHPLDHCVYPAAKRILDIGLCWLLFPVVLPLMGIISILIMLDSQGPIFFVQERVGKDGRLFRIFKYRTMYQQHDDAETKSFMQAFVTGQATKEEGTTIYKPIQSQQITNVGRFLRKTSLDELPQIFNVLRGEMSLVGPRPNVQCEVDVYQEWHKQRLKVLPGITGLAQINGRSSIPFDQIVQYDLEYIEKWCLWLDMRILARTFLIVFLQKGVM